MKLEWNMSTFCSKQSLNSSIHLGCVMCNIFVRYRIPSLQHSYFKFIEGCGEMWPATHT
jgi:hypothetical protein